MQGTDLLVPQYSRGGRCFHSQREQCMCFSQAHCLSSAIQKERPHYNNAEIRFLRFVRLFHVSLLWARSNCVGLRNRHFYWSLRLSYVLLVLSQGYCHILAGCLHLCVYIVWSVL